ncbi:MAG: hypothetical protein JWM28_2590 [Chitinophagaceae bacterium]|nr:hypothetical protein [Chitinophagaceae bacterium]
MCFWLLFPFCLAKTTSLIISNFFLLLFFVEKKVVPIEIGICDKKSPDGYREKRIRRVFRMVP